MFGLGTLVGGLAHSSATLIAARAVMGIGAAFIMPATLSLITAIFPPEERTRAIAVWAGFAGAGGAIGPVVTGALLEWFWWGSTLLVNVPFVIGIIVAVVAFAPDSRDDTKSPLDPTGAALSLVGVSSLIFAIIQGPEDGWTSGRVLAAFIVAAISFVAFVAWERRSDHPMLPMTLFSDCRFSTGAGVIAAVVHLTGGVPLVSPVTAIMALLLVLTVAYLMVSTWRFYSFKDIHFNTRQPFRLMILLAAIFVSIWFWSRWVLFGIALIYMFSGVWWRLQWLIRRRPSPPPRSVPRAG